jgi:glycosyltransferase involved in cell wall biosynthesis
VKVFVASAAEMLTDQSTHGEGLIAWQMLSALADRGHELVVCAPRLELTSEPPFETVEIGRTSRWESLEPLTYARAALGVFEERGGAAGFDAVHWLFPGEPLCFAPPSGVNFVIGPLLPRWRSPRSRSFRLGDAVRLVATPLFAHRRRRALGAATEVLVSIPAAVDELPPSARLRAKVHPFGVDASRFRPTTLPAAPTVLYVGRLEPQKRAADLVAAFASVVGALPDAQLLIAGDGSEREYLELLSGQLGIASSVTFLGSVPHDEVADVLARGSLLCLPSVGEPFGMVVLEAMASGRAVVAVDAGGPGYLLRHGEGSVLVDRGTPAELAEALTGLLSDRPRLEAMGRFNRTRVEAELDLARIAEALETAYAGEAVHAEETAALSEVAS